MKYIQLFMTDIFASRYFAKCDKVQHPILLIYLKELYVRHLILIRVLKLIDLNGLR